MRCRCCAQIDIRVAVDQLEYPPCARSYARIARLAKCQSNKEGRLDSQLGVGPRKHLALAHRALDCRDPLIERSKLGVFDHVSFYNSGRRLQLTRDISALH